ncbi:GntR family transcriptional regulator [Enhydrobacter aerosaccus]|uniref:GntR family transcriptional regulator n=1 Tax=Enhydrobacter aerosaccus TaxID=225324 RepID=UPI001C437832|nr:GntR family transcriptional regulator [Enhydrobacter aerosaccus]
MIVDGRSVGRAGLDRRVVEHLRRMIVRCDLPPAATISETKLCVQLGVSRTPLREALKLLAAEGLVDLRPNRRPVVRPISSSEIVQLFEAVGAVERAAAELAAERITPAALRRLSILQARMEEHYAVGQKDAYSNVNADIHRAIVAGAGNPVLIETHGSLQSRAKRARFAAFGASGRWEESVAEHRDILQALLDRDTVNAGKLLFDHVIHTGRAVVEALKEAPRRSAA